MCNFASFECTKDKVFWSKKTDSHSEIIKEFSLFEHGTHGACVVPVEIVPPDNDYTAPLDKWIFRVDDGMSSIYPDWWDAPKYEAMCRAELREQIAEKIVLPGQVFDEVKDGYKAVVFGEIKSLSETSRVVVMLGTSQVGVMLGTSRVGEMWGTSRVGVMRETSQVGEMWGTSRVGEMKDFSITQKYKNDKCTIICAYPKKFKLKKHTTKKGSRSMITLCVDCHEKYHNKKLHG